MLDDWISTEVSSLAFLALFAYPNIDELKEQEPTPIYNSRNFICSNIRRGEPEPVGHIYNSRNFICSNIEHPEGTNL